MKIALQGQLPSTDARADALRAFKGELPRFAELGQHQSMLPFDARRRLGQKSLEVPANSWKTVTRNGGLAKELEERIFNSLVELKVSVSEFATHLSDEERQAIFTQLDDVINVDDWHEEDELPRAASFRDLLRWVVHSGLSGWSSVGVADDGNILVAWSTPLARLTANFDGLGHVRWTSRVKANAEAEPAHAAGKCSLVYFTRQAKFTLG